jgi:uncharacterized protein YggL (DUF469 family)
MAVTWKITDTMYKPQIGEFQNVIWQVHWFASDTDGTNHSWAQGHAILDTDNLNSETFATFDSLTESQVIALLHASIGSHKEEIEQAIADAIAEGSVEETRSGRPSSW